MPQKFTQQSILEQLKRAGQPLSFRALCERLSVAGKAEKRQVTPLLEELVSAGTVLINRNGDYGLVQEMQLLRGRVMGHADGYGFLRTEQGPPDAFLPPRQMSLVFPGDVVLARPAGADRRGREKVSIVDVLERNTQELAGRYHEEAGVSWVVPDNPQTTHQVLIPPDRRGGARNGELVRVRITRQPERDLQPMAAVEDVLGSTMNVATRIDIAITEFGLPREFPPAVIAELRDVQRPALTADCRDCRNIEFVTIDGADAKDFDDAVHAVATAKGWRLWVAIADVSRYVTPGSALDGEARERGTSIYFPGRVIPMLPPALSDDLCSLRPDEDRHALICEMLIDHDGQLRSSKFFPGLIRSRARLIYDDVARVLNQGEAHPQAGSLKVLHGLFEVLHAARQERGALDFEGREVFFDVGDDGCLQDIRPLQRNVAHRMIEECMIMANVAAARYLRRHKLHSLNRIHPAPPLDSLADFRRFLAEWGLVLGGRQAPGPEHYQAVLQAVAGTPQATLVQGALLRTLSQAQYSPAMEGHFGLALADYAHFTSPIRRYPDLMVHRAIKWRLQAEAVNEQAPWSFDAMEKLGAHCSDRERRADQASWSVIEALKCEFLAGMVGQEFTGEIVGVTNFGLFVELDAYRASGLVHISSLGRDYFVHEPTLHRLRGDRSGVMYRLGDQMKVRLVRADAQERKIDFEPLAHRSLLGGKAGSESSQWRDL